MASATGTKEKAGDKPAEGSLEWALAQLSSEIRDNRSRIAELERRLASDRE